MMVMVDKEVVDVVDFTAAVEVEAKIIKNMAGLVKVDMVDIIHEEEEVDLHIQMMHITKYKMKQEVTMALTYPKKC